MSVLQCGRFRLDLSQPRVMAIINLTDDSFSGDGLRGDLARALARAERALEEGAEMLDIGAESTRPGSDPVPEAQELERVVRFVEAARDWKVPLSIDTVKPAVMRAAFMASSRGRGCASTPGALSRARRRRAYRRAGGWSSSPCA